MPLVKRSNSKFWYVQFQLNHRTYVRSSRTADRKVAQQFEARMRATVHAEMFLGEKKSTTLREALDQFAASKAGTANHPNIVGHQRVILALLDGARLLDRFSTSDLEDFKRARLAGGSHPQTVKHALGVLSGVVHLAKRCGYRTPEIDMPSIALPKPRTRYLSVDEERRLLVQLDPNREARGLAPVDKRSPELRAMLQDSLDLVILLLDTGARYGEIAMVRRTQIDLQQRSIRLWRPKVQNESILFMTDRVFDVLGRRCQVSNAEFVFTNKAGEHRSHSAGAIRKALDRAGLTDCTIHTLRHTHATRLIQNGMNIYEVKHLLGHADIKTTMRYAHMESISVARKARDVANTASLSSLAPHCAGG